LRIDLAKMPTVPTADAPGGGREMLLE